jgi:Cu/Zn superoxide dismutase
MSYGILTGSSRARARARAHTHTHTHTHTSIESHQAKNHTGWLPELTVTYDYEPRGLGNKGPCAADISNLAVSY